MASEGLTIVGAGNTILFVSVGYMSEYFDHAVARAKVGSSIKRTISYPASEYSGSTAIDGEFKNLSYDTTYTIEVIVYQSDGQVSSTRSGEFTTDPEPTPTYTCSAEPGLSSSERLSSCTVSSTYVEEGDSVTFSARAASGCIFVCWSTTFTPTASSIVSYDQDYTKAIYSNTTLYAIAGVLPAVSANIYNNGSWHAALGYIYKNSAWHELTPDVYKDGWQNGGD